MRSFRRVDLVLVCFFLCGTATAQTKSQNVIVVTLDGFRWQEFFTGADETFMDKPNGGVRDIPGLKRRYLKPSAEERREVLLPFMWGTIAKHGQIFGDPTRQAAARVTNGLKFSYPGYNELFCGFGDPEITSNDKKQNRNLSVLEHLNGRPGFAGRVSIVGTWDVFPSIFRTAQNGLKIHSGWEPIRDEPLSDRQRATNAIMAELPRYWPDNVFDTIAMQAARENLRKHRPRVLYVALGETDEWGHGRRYDLYLDAARFADRFISEMWTWLQEQPEYAGKTSLIITTDHGRGMTRTDWTDHNKDVPGAEYIWIAVLGPDTPPLGVRRGVEATQSQVAATVAALVGEDFNAASPKAAKPLADIGNNRP